MYLFLCFSLLVTFSNLGISRGAENDEYYVICYFTDWSNQLSDRGKFTPDDIASDHCTHVVYAFTEFNESSNSLEQLDPKGNIIPVEQLVEQKKNGIRILLSVGGWYDSTEKYSKMMSDEGLRKEFAKNAVEYMRENQFDGFEIDLEYPGAWQEMYNRNWSEDKNNFVSLLNEIREQMNEGDDPENKSILAISGSPSRWIIDGGYDIHAIMEIVDWISVIAFDLHGCWDFRTGVIAPFTPQPDDRNLELNVQAVMEMYLERGAPPNKLILGVSSYGRSYRLYDPEVNGIGAPTTGPGFPGKYTEDEMSLSFYEIIEIVKSENWNVVHVDNVGSYAHNKTYWVGFDDKVDIYKKAQYAMELNLRGVSLWSLDLDDFHSDGPCGQYPLLSTISNTLKGNPSTEIENCA